MADGKKGSNSKPGAKKPMPYKPGQGGTKKPLPYKPGQNGIKQTKPSKPGKKPSTLDRMMSTKDYENYLNSLWK